MFSTGKIVILILFHVLTSAEGLDYQEKLAILNENCSRFLSLNSSSGDVLNCPPWYHPSEDGSRCINGTHAHYVMFFMQGTGQPWVQTFYCMTTTGNASDGAKRDIVGNCPFSFDVEMDRMLSTYYPLPCNISKLNDYTCAALNREGQLCGRCKKGFAPPVYTYSFICVNCTDYSHYNWIKYVGIAFGPLTIFCLIICILGITANSQYLSGLIFLSQILTSPTILRLLVNTYGYTVNSDGTQFWEHFYVSLFSFWNLDLFRAFYHPFCLHPDMTFLQALSLDYLIALYPLLLLLLLLVVAKLHSRNIRIIVILWRPFRRLFKTRLHNDDVQNSLFKSIATLYFLSAMKVQSVSLDLLAPTPSYHMNEGGSFTDTKYFLLLSGDVKYFGPHHFLYAITTLIFLTLFLVFPAILLFLYPYSFFQKFLNRIRCNSLRLKFIMDVFQGNYRYRTEHSRDYRIFSGFFFVTRFAVVASIILFNSFFSLVFSGLLILSLGFAVIFFHPQTKRLHYILDSITFVILSLLLIALIGNILTPADIISWRMSSFINTVSVSLPLFFMIGIFCHWLIARKRIPQNIAGYLRRRIKQIIFIKKTESQRLLTIN